MDHLLENKIVIYFYSLLFKSILVLKDIINQQILLAFSNQNLIYLRKSFIDQNLKLIDSTLKSL